MKSSNDGMLTNVEVLELLREKRAKNTNSGNSVTLQEKEAVELQVDLPYQLQLTVFVNFVVLIDSELFGRFHHWENVFGSVSGLRFRAEETASEANGGRANPHRQLWAAERIGFLPND